MVLLMFREQTHVGIGQMKFVIVVALGAVALTVISAFADSKRAHGTGAVLKPFEETGPVDKTHDPGDFRNTTFGSI